MNQTDIDRVERERDYHNARFSSETRTAQGKYYWALSNCRRRWEQELTAAATGARVLEYGCAQGEWALKIAATAKRVDAIDISDVAINQARNQAMLRGASNVFFETMDAQATSFPDNTFDLVFGSGIIHHLDTRRSLEEIHRILKPGGTALFSEPLGCNMLINAYRALTPDARTPDEHPLLPVDKRIADSIFASVKWEFHGLFTIGAVPFRNSPLGNSIHGVAARLDRMIGQIPGLRWQLWNALISLKK